MPEISVLLPVYNPDIRMLTQAVDSILNQTYSDFELLIYDDGSIDSIATEIRSLAECDSRIRLITGDGHHNIAYGLNTLVRESRGKYLARMDSDDISKSQRLEIEYRFMEENPEIDFVGSNLELIDEDGKAYGERKYPIRPVARDFLRYQPYAHPAMMFRREVLNEENPYGTKDGNRRGEDYEMLMKLVSEGKRGYNLQENLLSYRESPGSYSRRKLRFQLEEVGIRWNGFKALGLNRFRFFGYVLKPIAVWAVPNRLAFRLKHK
jgi:glycosyltransferase involved in cell wall biosynthesis